MSAILVAGCASTSRSADAPSGSATAEANAAQGQHSGQHVTVSVKSGKASVSTGGKVADQTGGVQLKQGEHVVLKVNSDVADEVHVHGYNLMKDVKPGQPVTFDFDATVPGQFEAELEGAHLTILRFTVQ
ncbi:MAG TPA: hypothetical protein VG674_28240 [Amycolatopsis sp.]|nr:hypothetical protein [Amycolatopsis sp.]